MFELKTNAKSKANKSLEKSGEAISGLHAKIYILDKSNIFIGSFDFDKCSEKISTEFGLVYEVDEMASLISKEIFTNNIDATTYILALVDGDISWIDNVDGVKVIYKTDPNTSIWRRILENIYSILPIESQR